MRMCEWWTCGCASTVCRQRADTALNVADTMSPIKNIPIHTEYASDSLRALCYSNSKYYNYASISISTSTSNSGKHIIKWGMAHHDCGEFVEFSNLARYQLNSYIVVYVVRIWKLFTSLYKFDDLALVAATAAAAAVTVANKKSWL